VNGEVVADRPDRRVEILCETDAMHATRTRIGPRRDGTDLHVHRRHNDVFYVLEGELTLRLGAEDTAVRASAGTLVLVPPLVVHGYRNASDADVRFLNVHAPGEGFAAYLRALRDGAPHDFDQHPPPPDGGRPATDAIVARDPAAAEVDAIHVAEATWGAAAGDWVCVLEGELRLSGGGVLAAGAWATLDADAANGSQARFVRVRTPGVA
jgi:mannose-6-phosphate isomerase-like protein (cupin superfamily)